MRLPFLLFCLLTFPPSLFAQKSALKSWEGINELIGMNSVEAEGRLANNGFKYVRSFEGLGVKFKVYEAGWKWAKGNFEGYSGWNDEKKAMPLHDVFVIGSSAGKVDFLKFEFIDEKYAAFETAMKNSGYTVDEQMELKRRALTSSIKMAEALAFMSSPVQDYPILKYHHPNRKHKINIRQLASGVASIGIFTDDIPFQLLNRGTYNAFAANTIDRKYVVDSEGDQTYEFSIFFNGVANTFDEDPFRNEKIAVYLNLFIHDFYANYPGYNLGCRNILFYAVRISFEDLIYEIFQTCKLNPYIVLWNPCSPDRKETIAEFVNKEVEEKRNAKPPDKNSIIAVERIRKYVLEATGTK